VSRPPDWSPDSQLRAGAQLEKLYFRIGEVASIVGVEPHVLRYWETEFRSVRPQKSARGQRIYSRRDVETLLKVKELLYGHRFTIAGAKRKLREGGVEPARPEPAEDPPPATAAASPAATEELRAIRDNLASLRAFAVSALVEVEAWLSDGAVVGGASEPAVRAAGPAVARSEVGRSEPGRAGAARFAEREEEAAK
jgi:DNA-binding transcriptional MerR regulator